MYIKRIRQQPEICLFKQDEKDAHNGYLLRDRRNCLLIDPPLRSRDDLNLLETLIRENKAADYVVHVFITHFHESYEELMQKFAAVEGILGIFISSEAVTAQRRGYSAEMLRNLYREEGLPEEEWMAAGKRRYCIRQDKKEKLRLVNDGDMIYVGGYTLHCMLLPGHTAGHMGLYMADEKLLFCGDALLFDRQPYVEAFSNLSGGMLSQYIHTLEKLAQYEQITGMTGHGICGEKIGDRPSVLIQQVYLRLLELYQMVYDQPGLSTYQLSDRYLMRRCPKEQRREQRERDVRDILAYLLYLRECKYTTIVYGQEGLINVPGSKTLTDGS